MTKQRRSFSAEFKREAADLVLKQNYSYIEASRSLGVGESALRRWVDHVHPGRTVVAEHSAHFAEHFDQASDEICRRLLEANLPIDAVIPQPEVGRAGHAALH